MATFLTHWKTTAQGFLSFIVITLTSILPFLVASDVAAGGASLGAIHVSTWVLVGCNAALALAKAYIAVLQKDPGTVLAEVPGTTDPKIVSAHETPDNPAATPVVKP